MRNINYSDDQLIAIERIVAHCEGKTEFNEMVLEGPAGSGKTTILSAVVGQTDKKILLTAPTNKAVRVIRQMAIRYEMPVESMTVYKALGLVLDSSGEIKEITKKDRNAKSDDDPLSEVDVLVVDEGSMINSATFEIIVSECRAKDIKLLFVGDRLQIPPVGEVESRVFGLPNIITLSVIERVAEDNPIIEVVTHIRECIDLRKYPQFRTAANDGVGVYTVNNESFGSYMRQGFSSDTYKNIEDSFKSVAWRNEVVNQTNQAIRLALYGADARDAFVLGERVIAGSPVMPPEDNPFMDMMNTDDEGEITDIKIMDHPDHPGDAMKVWQLNLAFYGGFVTAYVIHQDSARDLDNKLARMAAMCRAKKLPWRAFWEYKESFNDIRPCHCITAHKSQGSTYENTFVNVTDIYANRNIYEALRILYVASSRASHRLIMKVPA